MAQDGTRAAVGDWIAAWSDATRTLGSLWAEAMPALSALTPPVMRPADAPEHGELATADWLAEQTDWWSRAWSGWAATFAAAAEPQTPSIPPDRRFADPRWNEPPFSLIRDGYLRGVAALDAAVDALPLGEAARAQARFAATAWADAVAPTNHPLTNPAVLARTIETGGENLRRGMAAMARDLEAGQLTHVAPGAYEVGRNLALTPGQVVHRTDLYELIQYAPATPHVLATPLVIFPPWINRFYILDLGPEKSFIKWTVDQGVTVFVVSWRSATPEMGALTWDDYVRAQIEAVDVVRAGLDVPAVHTIGYCVAGTTLAATLAVLAARGQADRVASATFFTAQVDFELAGDLKHFVGDEALGLVERLSAGGTLDGRVMAATFNLLRGRDLIWGPVVRHWLMGEEPPEFDLLHWNGHTTNLPAAWHGSYLRDLYRDNRLVEPGALSADGTAVDLTRVATPAYIQAGREDHIAPAESVWRMTRHLSGPIRFVLAGIGAHRGRGEPPGGGQIRALDGGGRVARPLRDVPGSGRRTQGQLVARLARLAGGARRRARRGRRRATAGRGAAGGDRAGAGTPTSERAECGGRPLCCSAT